MSLLEAILMGIIQGVTEFSAREQLGTSGAF